MRERRPPTHILTVEVPVDIKATEDLSYDAVMHAMTTVLEISRAAADHVICDDIKVTMVESEPPLGKPWIQPIRMTYDESYALLYAIEMAFGIDGEPRAVQMPAVQTNVRTLLLNAPS